MKLAKMNRTAGPEEKTSGPNTCKIQVLPTS